MSSDGILSKKFQVSKTPYICGDRAEANKVIVVLSEPSILQIHISRAGFNKVISNRKFINDSEKLYNVR